jgi:hypothetical protein
MEGALRRSGPGTRYQWPITVRHRKHKDKQRGKGAAAAAAAAAALRSAAGAAALLCSRCSTHSSWLCFVSSAGAPKTREFTEAELQALSKFSMVTIEKWYTSCASKGPTQSGPECAVEDKMYTAFRRIKAINPNVTTIMYLNSNFDFAFYRLHGEMMAMEARGQQAFLRDERGDVVELCNDGNVYCNITTFDHTIKAVQELWTATIVNATEVGGVDGAFMDHAYNNPRQFCNGGGSKRSCWSFSPEFTARFIDGHNWLLNHTQTILAATTGGPVIGGPQKHPDPDTAAGAVVCPGVWNQPTTFQGLREATARGLNGTGPYVIEASRGGACDLATDESKLAGCECASTMSIPPCKHAGRYGCMVAWGELAGIMSATHCMGGAVHDRAQI